MRPVFIVAICCLATFLYSSCGNSHQEERKATPASSVQPAESPSAQQPSQQADNRPVVVAFGDSLTQGVSGESYPAYLQGMLNQNGYRYRVENQGVSGDTTSDGLARIENVIAEKPALVILEFGGNDGLRGIPVEETKKNLDQMIGKLRAAKIPLALAGITLPPNYGPDYIRKFEGIFKGLADQYKVPLIPFLLEGVAGHANLMQKDGLHPTAEGTRIVAVNVMRALEPLL